LSPSPFLSLHIIFQDILSALPIQTQFVFSDVRQAKAPSSYKRQSESEIRLTRQIDWGNMQRYEQV